MKKLGQHFLIKKNKITKIIDALNIKNDTIIEIGPGHGEITKTLINKLLNNQITKLIAVEKDQLLAKNLEDKIQNLKIKNVKIIKGDILKILPQLPEPCGLNSKSYKLVGNIPYYITGHLLRIISNLKNKPLLIILTIQKEVAERICAKAPRMNLLSASVQFWAKPKIIGYISKNNFRPQPKVDSAIIKLTPKSFNLNSKSYYHLIKILFKQPRKMIINNLTVTMTIAITKNEIIEKLKKININPNDRPQNLNIAQLIKLSKLFNLQ